ncbi:endoribonuclease YbeY [Chelatococcus asaccharovorans]|uniref:Endoribonuclease YbeY n=1 Tax=Chelatococcus asaccharovorans TaxID=28210 RepID=A0A2V3U6Q1_9HYPH|nr:putative rRNA maturation factor [Chelatococcus asaccharovorans]CAH1658539.1 endoribonuclease YbeY [Chelatococcus asaccharovorans]CAH1684477.1 endoribonuclease YbeY [Chelatococcus asaccharovorans]
MTARPEPHHPSLADEADDTADALIVNGLVVDITVEAGDWSALPLASLIQRAVAAALEEAPVKPAEGAEVSIMLTDDAHIRALNRQWRGFDKPTNVLSFPAAEPEAVGESSHLGDIVLAGETIAREAAGDDKSVSDHLCHLVIHGILHLLGEDHLDDEEAEAMEAREVAALARIGIANPYTEPHDV